MPLLAQLPPLSISGPQIKVDSTLKTPQQLSREAIDEFRAIYQEEFGETLSDDEVREIATRLLRFFGIFEQALTEPR